ncbi:hypothetical protein D3C79_706240 [compost metagenome]
MKLATQAFHPAFTLAHQRIGALIGEVDMRAGHPLCKQFVRQLIHQLGRRLRVAKQARAGHRRERHGAEQLGVIGNACPLTGIGPAVVEYVLAE